MRFRQVHLDFHTSEHIPGIGERFDKRQFQQMLRRGRVDSINLFSKCHHGLSYHPTKVGRMHPHLQFDLLGAQIEACKEIGVLTPVYLSSGLDEVMYWQNGGWARRSDPEGRVPWAGRNDAAGFHEMCLNTPYLDYLLEQVEEVLGGFDCDGLFLDIVGPRSCWCNICVRERLAEGDPSDPALLQKQARRTYFRYTHRVKNLVERVRPGTPIFQNTGHITRGDREAVAANTHLELESLPTGGWGYDHFPVSVAYARTLGPKFLGMTGKFHMSWGEFGGYKHPNALIYEACAALAHGARFCVGDQLHPDGHMEDATYAIIGAAYDQVEQKQAWVEGAQSTAEVAILSYQAVEFAQQGDSERSVAHDDGAARMLLQGQIPFDVLDVEADFSRYRLLVLPDKIRCDSALAEKLRGYVAGGGRLVATGESGMALGRDEQLLDFGVRDAGPGEFDPSYVAPKFPWPVWEPMASVVYGPVRKLELTHGEVLAHAENPYFNRELSHFCSHSHAPNRRGDAGPAIVRGAAGVWLAFDACRIYRDVGSQSLRDMFLHCVRTELGEPQIATSLPSSGRVTVSRQSAQKRDVVHLLHATPMLRGMANGASPIEVIEDLIPVHDVEVSVKRPTPPSRVTLEPQGESVPFQYSEGRVSLTVPEVHCHQMVVLAD